MNNYPDGAANDPSAPWNQKEPVMEECCDCIGIGKIIDDPEPITCPRCKGTGETEVEDEE